MTTIFWLYLPSSSSLVLYNFPKYRRCFSYKVSFIHTNEKTQQPHKTQPQKQRHGIFHSHSSQNQVEFSSSSSITKHFVFVKRNKQSMAFRNGSPLIFSGSIDSIISIAHGGIAAAAVVVHPHSFESSSYPSLFPVGTMVTIMVEGKNKNDEEESSSNSNKNKSTKKTLETNKKEVLSIPHFLLPYDPRIKRNNDSSSDIQTLESAFVHEWTTTLMKNTTTTTTSSNTANHPLSRSISSWKKSNIRIDLFQKRLSDATIIGYGVWNPFSMYKVRILCHLYSHPTLFHRISTLFNSLQSEKEHQQLELNTNHPAIPRMSAITTTTPTVHEQKVMEIILETKIKQAKNIRQQLHLPSIENNSYRLVNGEGDGLSGLVVDILGGQVAVIMSSALWCELYKDIILSTVDTILNADMGLSSFTHDMNHTKNRVELVWRNTPSRLIQDGIQSLPELQQQQQPEENTSITANNTAKAEESILVVENGIKYYTYPWDMTSQKTGFYCDQRENRVEFAKFCQDKHVLDLCCFNGGFSLSAILVGHASHATGVDSSPVAIDAARKNALLNGLEENQMEFIRDDITAFMKTAALNGTEYDVIALDPPKLAPSLGDLERASRKYHSLNRDAMKLINKETGGILMTCTCSSAMTQKDGGQYFLQMIKEASLAAGRQITLLKTSGAAQCHTQCPASYPAGVYLTAAWIHVHPLG